MMKLIILLISLMSIVVGKEYTLENCKCWDDYEPVKREDGSVVCEGIILDSWVVCDRPQAPRCICGEGVTGILHDKAGIWCSTHAAGKLIRRWPCENKDDWTEFKEKLAEYKKGLGEGEGFF